MKKLLKKSQWNRLLVILITISAISILIALMCIGVYVANQGWVNNLVTLIVITFVGEFIINCLIEKVISLVLKLLGNSD